MSTSDPTLALALAARTFHEAIHRAVAASIAFDGPLNTAAVLTGHLAKRLMFAEVVALTEAARAFTEAQNTHYDAVLAARLREHQAVMREDDGTPDYLREGSE